MRLVWILIIVGLAIFAWKKTPDWIASTLSDKMQVAVKIGEIGLSTEQVSVQKVEIANPAGSTLPKAFSVDSIKVDAPLTNYIKDAIVIDEIDLNNIYLSLELASANGMAGNWGKIIDNLKKSSGTESSAPAKEEPKEKSNKSVLIKKLVLTNVNVEMVNGLLGNKVTKLDTIPKLEFTDISSENGVPLEQIISLIMTQALKQQSVGGIIEKVAPKDLLDKLPIPIPFNLD